MTYNPECPDDAPFPNVVEVLSRKVVDGVFSVVLRQTVRANINARNCTVMFPAATSEPSRAEVLLQAAKEGATRATCDYVGVCVEPMSGGGFMASIEQIDYVYPVDEIPVSGVGVALNASDAEVVAWCRANGKCAGEISP